MTLPPYISREEVHRRRQEIFPEGTPNRNYCTREMAASTVFVMLYIGAVEGQDQFLAPKQIYRMTDRQAARLTDAERRIYSTSSLKPRFSPKGRRWYADNTREPIRDETLKEGLCAVGAVVARIDLPTTSSKPRYALARRFAELFAPNLLGDQLQSAIRAWQEANLTPGALARIRLQRQGLSAGQEGPLVKLPNGESRRLAVGPSSDIVKAVLEELVPRFLLQPALILLSESRQKILAQDDRAARSIGLEVKLDRDLPDLILADLEPAKPLLIFVEAVATDGAITPQRRQALLSLTGGAGFKVAFVSAFLSRDLPVFWKAVSQLAWQTFAWFASEPEKLLMLHDGALQSASLQDFLAVGTG